MFMSIDNHVCLNIPPNCLETSSLNSALDASQRRNETADIEYKYDVNPEEGKLLTLFVVCS